jgi:hypothetical protein
MLTYQNLILLGAFLSGFVPSVAFAQTSQPTSSPTNKPNTPLFPFGNINPVPQGDPLFPFANPTPTNLTPAVSNTSDDRSSLAPGILYGGAAAFGVAGIIGAVVAVSFKTKAKQATNLEPGEAPNQAQADEANQLISATRTTAILSDVSFGLSISGVVGGYLLSKRAKAKPEAAPSKITPY